LLSSCATLETTPDQLAATGVPTAPPEPLAPDQETRKVTEALQRTGAIAPQVQDVLSPAAEEAFRETFGTSSPAAEFSGKATCFRAGCSISAIYSDPCIVQRASRAAFEIPTSAMLRWPGAIYKTPAVKRSDGRFDVTWLFLLSDTPKLPDDQGKQFEARQRTRLEALVQKKPIVQPAVLQQDTCTSTGPILRDTTPANPNKPVAK
jgi:hypothetical protein